jgi:hypothetical protein
MLIWSFREKALHGVHYPGKSKLDTFRPEIEALLAHGSTQKFIAHRYQTTEANLHNWLKKCGIQKPRIVEPMAGTKRGRGRVL